MSINKNENLSNISKVWDIISTESNLELFHPFCRKNRSINWPGRESVDEIEYLNRLTFIRKFTNVQSQINCKTDK